MPVSHTLIPEHVQNLPVGLYPEQHVGDCDVLELAFLSVWKVDLETEVTQMSKIFSEMSQKRNLWFHKYLWLPYRLDQLWVVEVQGLGDRLMV